MEQQRIFDEANESEIVSTQTVSSKTRTVETITVSLLKWQQVDFVYKRWSFQYKTERDGVVETRVEQKITIQSDGDPIDHDKALAEAIQVRFSKKINHTESISNKNKSLTFF